ncbi:hypothetical protein MSG28_013586 [Choristoneura fumiferana]|uniref:Uncharacterized protein n=1 Tax=Choristoneura fumiferana TaxID=7141 RepID=A0ACC0K888_CHOFU|nr:hypothetical protein MSG28_013586 [Choristoneura fumiferana]
MDSLHEDAYQDFTVTQLREELRFRYLPVSGTKRDIIARIIEDNQQKINDGTIETLKQERTRRESQLCEIENMKQQIRILEQQNQSMPTIREILLHTATTASTSKDVVDQMHDAVLPFMPPEWKNWQIEDINIRELVGDPPDLKIINKLRYAIPTADIAAAFKLKELSEKAYKTIKLKMLDWPFTSALIYAPFALAAKIHGKNVENILNVVRTMKPHLLSREDTDGLLRGLSPGHGQKRSVSPPARSPARTKRLKTPSTGEVDPVAAAIQKQSEMFSALMTQMMAATNNTAERVIEAVNSIKEIPNQTADTNMADSTYSDIEVESEYDDEEGQDSQIKSPETPASAMHDREEAIATLCFDTITTEAEPPIPMASANMEAEKTLQGTPVFTALKVNPQLSNITPKWCNPEILLKIDKALGVLTHAFLLERQALEDGLQQVAREVKDPLVITSIQQNVLSKESNYRRISDQALQYACGRRAEIIAARRSYYSPSDKACDAVM